MKESEIIIVDGISEEQYYDIVEDSVKYAIISAPFTYNRMHKEKITQQILNIAKGKIAEGLFLTFCKANNIPADEKPCTTGFWTPDKRDFKMNDKAWDIKNNFYNSPSDLYQGNYIDFPALVPKDQWASKDDKRKLPEHTDESAFVFTFMRKTNTNYQNFFLSININDAQVDFLDKKNETYHGMGLSEQPYSETDFWPQFDSLGDSNTKLFTLSYLPILIITSYACKDQWGLFEYTGPNEPNNLHDYLSPSWYNKKTCYSQKTKKEYIILNFLNGSICPTFPNATCPVAKLPSFLSLFPHLKDEIKLGYIKSSDE